MPKGLLLLALLACAPLARGGEGAPRPVEVTFALVDIPVIDEQVQRFQVVGYIRFRWQDPAAAFTPKEGDAETREYEEEAVWTKLAEMWNPAFELVNQVGESRRQYATLSIAADGAIELSWKVDAIMSGHLNLHRFPFDTQALSLQVESFNFAEDKLVMVKAPELEGRPLPEILPQNWRLIGREAVLSISPSTFDERYSRITFTYRVKRQALGHVWQVMLPLGLIALACGAVFFMGPRSFVDRISHVVTCLFAVVALNFILGTNLPSISYLTLMDRFFVATYLLIAFVGLEAFVVNRLEARRPEAAAALDRAAPALGAGLLALLVGLAFATGL